MLLLLCLLVGLGSVPSAQAASVPFHGKAWKKGSKIRVQSTLGKRYDKAVDAAIANYATARTGARISFVRVGSRKRAQVVLRRMNEPFQPPGIGDSQGYPGKRLVTIRLNLKLGGFDRQTAGYTEKGNRIPPDPFAATMLIAHELSHVVGLDHTRRCSIANPGFFQACKSRGDDDFYGNFGPRTYSCDFVQRIDAQVLAKRYGGKAKAITGKKICRMDNGQAYVAPKAPPPSQIGAAVTDAPGVLPVITWTPQKDAEIFIGRYDMPCSAVKDDSPSEGVEGPGGTGVPPMSAGRVEDGTEYTGTSPIVCYGVSVTYGKSWGNHTVRTLLELVWQP